MNLYEQTVERRSFDLIVSGRCAFVMHASPCPYQVGDAVRLVEVDGGVATGAECSVIVRCVESCDDYVVAGVEPYAWIVPGLSERSWETRGRA